MKIAHCTPQDSASLDHPLGQTHDVIHRGCMHIKWNSPLQYCITWHYIIHSECFVHAVATSTTVGLLAQIPWPWWLCPVTEAQGFVCVLYRQGHSCGFEYWLREVEPVLCVYSCLPRAFEKVRQDDRAACFAIEPVVVNITLLSMLICRIGLHSA